MSESTEKQAFSLRAGDWAIVGDGGRSFFGQVAISETGEHGISLDPAYEYIAQTSLDPMRGIQRIRMIVPLEMLHSATRISVHARSVMLIADLDETDRREIESMRTKAEELRSTLRAQRSGIVAPRVGISAVGKVIG